MRRASEALGPALNTQIPSGSFSERHHTTDWPCPDCGKIMSVVVQEDVVLAFPQLAEISKLIVCNDCADFRHAVSNLREVMSYVRRWIVRRVLMVQKKADGGDDVQEESSSISEKARDLARVPVSKLIRFVAGKAGRSPLPPEKWINQLTNVWTEDKLYGGEVVRRIDFRDNSEFLTKNILYSHGIVLKSHWPSSDQSMPEPP